MSPSIGSGRPLLAGWRPIPGPPRDRVKARLLRLYVALERRYGPRRRGPGRTPHEIAVGAILMRSSRQSVPALALRELRSRGLLDPARLARAKEADVARTAGTSLATARRICAFARWLLERFAGRFHGVRRSPLASLRRDLLRGTGIGPETTDAILLHAAGRPVFAVDDPVRRVLGRHRLIAAHADREAVRAFVERHLPSDPVLFSQYHGLLAAVGGEHCGVIPRCAGCPLRFDLRGRPPAMPGAASGRPKLAPAGGGGSLISRGRPGRTGRDRRAVRRRPGRPARARDRPSP